MSDERKRRIAQALLDARQRTVELVATVDDERLHAQPDPILSPLAWDYGPVGVYEELWLVDALSGERPADERRLAMYDAFTNPRSSRAALPLMGRAAVDSYRDGVRAHALELLEEAELDGEDPLLRDGYVYGLVVQHEHQHAETMLQSLQILPGGLRPVMPPLLPPRAVQRDTVLVPAGTYPIGNPHHEPYDNEAPQHDVDLRAYGIDRFPVTCGDWLRFIDEGGYGRRELWDADGWQWREQSGERAPKHWRRGDGGLWTIERFGHGATTRPPPSGPTSTSAPTRRRRSAAIPPGPARSAASRWSATSGSGRRARSCPTPASAPSPTGNTRRSSSAASTACCAGPRGRRGRASPGPASATGTTRSAGRSSPGCAAPTTPPRSVVR